MSRITFTWFLNVTLFCVGLMGPQCYHLFPGLSHAVGIDKAPRMRSGASSRNQRSPVAFIQTPLETENFKSQDSMREALAAVLTDLLPLTTGGLGSKHFESTQTLLCLFSEGLFIMGNGINKILPHLYLGNLKDARNVEQLARNNITHILSIHENAAPVLPMMTYLCISAADLPTQNLAQFFKQSVAFVHESRLKGEGCIIHCLAGVSRSVTLVVAYIMTVTGLGWQDALAAVKVVRPCAAPNLGFQQQLQEFETTQAAELREWLWQKYKENPFNDEADLCKLLSRTPSVSGEVEGPASPPPEEI